MGMYTEIYINVDLKTGTPIEVLDMLAVMCGEKRDKGVHQAVDDMGDRFGLLFHNMSYYTANTCCGKLTYDRITNQYSLLGKGDIKNYEGEIEKFFEWLAPYIDGYDEFIGYSRFEESLAPILYYMYDGKLTTVFTTGPE